jgi:hypothetical protein
MGSSHSRCRKLIAATCGVLVMVGCGSGRDTSPHTSPHDSAHGASSPSGSASVPAAPADGADLTACADGRCEIRVGPSARIPVPSGLGIASLSVRSVGSGTVTVVGRDIGDDHSGTCESNCSGTSVDNGFQLTLGPGGTGSQNRLSITAVAVHGGFAVLRLAPV